jgi:hypothetical protein
VRKIKEWLSEARGKKHVHSDELDRIINRCLNKYGHLFPKYLCTRKGSKSVHHFNVPNVPPISIERVHGDREFVPPRYAAFIIDGLDCLITHIESNRTDEDNDPDNA